MRDKIPHFLFVILMNHHLPPSSAPGLTGRLPLLRLAGEADFELGRRTK